VVLLAPLGILPTAFSHHVLDGELHGQHGLGRYGSFCVTSHVRRSFLADRQGRRSASLRPPTQPAAEAVQSTADAGQPYKAGSATVGATVCTRAPNNRSEATPYPPPQ
jgi:hypothetical protein